MTEYNADARPMMHTVHIDHDAFFVVILLLVVIMKETYFHAEIGKAYALFYRKTK